MNIEDKFIFKKILERFAEISYMLNNIVNRSCSQNKKMVHQILNILLKLGTYKKEDLYELYRYNDWLENLGEGMTYTLSSKEIDDSGINEYGRTLENWELEIMRDDPYDIDEYLL